jgi:hypothetical protein
MQTLALHIDRPFLRAALIQKGRLGFKICALKTTALAEPENVKLLYKLKFKGRVVSGLSSKDVMLRPIDLNIGKTRHIEAALGFQSEGITHLNLDDVVSMPHLIKKSAGKVKALHFAASRAHLKSHLDEFAKINVDLDCVSANSLGLIHFFRWKEPDLSDAFLVDLGSSEWTCVLMEGGELKKSHALGSGTEALLTAFWEDRKKILLPKEVEGVAKQIDLLQIKPHLNPLFSEKLVEIRQELAKAIFSFSRCSNQKPIVFTGQIDAFGHLKEFLMESVKETVAHEAGELLDLDEKKYAIPIGLGIEQAGQPLQLLAQEFFPKKNWRRAGGYGLLLLFLSLSISSLFLCVGLNRISARKAQMVRSFQGIISLWDPQLKNTLLEDEEMALKQWTHGVEKYNKEYPYILDVPRAAKVLSWLSQHPLLLEFKMENDPLEVKTIRYQLVEYPKIGSLQNRYRAKVDLQFKVKSPMSARRFHEALLQGDEIVDPNSEVSWEALSDSYRASFFLNATKASYVP